MEPNFRYLLRQNTRTEHAQLDQLISSLDITTRPGFTQFLQLHLCCFMTMRARLSEQCICQSVLDDMIRGLRADLAAVSGAPLDLAPEICENLDPLAIDYIVAGSRLGSKILCGIWAQTEDPLVRRARTYFQQPVDPTLWKKTCEALAHVPPEAARAQVIIRDTRALFALFAQVLDTLPADQDALV